MPLMKTLTINGETFIIDDSSATKFVEQSLTDGQKAQARENIGVEESGNNSMVVAQPQAPSDTSAIWIDTDDDYDDGFQEAVNSTLRQAKASGEFDGVSVTHNWNGTVLTVTSASGSSSADLRGPRYELTDADKASIAEAVVGLLPVYNGEVV